MLGPLSASLDAPNDRPPDGFVIPVFAPAAIAGIGELPDTITDRSVVIRMRRRASHESVEPFRRRKHEPAGRRLHDALAAWARADNRQARLGQTEPELPAGLVDRPADVWEPLITIADAAGSSWPARAAPPRSS